MYKILSFKGKKRLEKTSWTGHTVQLPYNNADQIHKLQTWFHLSCKEKEGHQVLVLTNLEEHRNKFLPEGRRHLKGRRKDVPLTTVQELILQHTHKQLVQENLVRKFGHHKIIFFPAILLADNCVIFSLSFFIEQMASVYSTCDAIVYFSYWAILPC